MRSEADVLGKMILFLSERYRRWFYARDQKVIRSGEPLLNKEEYFFDKEGIKTWLLTSKLPLRDEQGNIIGLVGVGRNITEEKRVQETLQHERNFCEH